MLWQGSKAVKWNKWKREQEDNGKSYGEFCPRACLLVSLRKFVASFGRFYSPAEAAASQIYHPEIN